MEIKSIKDIFDKNGDWIVMIDPFSVDEDNPIYQYLFDEKGHTREAIIDEAIKYANEINAPWHSSIAKYIFSERFDVACKENYSAIYAWR